MGKECEVFRAFQTLSDDLLRRILCFLLGYDGKGALCWARPYIWVPRDLVTALPQHGHPNLPPPLINFVSRGQGAYFLSCSKRGSALARKLKLAPVMARQGSEPRCVEEGRLGGVWMPLLSDPTWALMDDGCSLRRVDRRMCEVVGQFVGRIDLRSPMICGGDSLRQVHVRRAFPFVSKVRLYPRLPSSLSWCGRQVVDRGVAVEVDFSLFDFDPVFSSWLPTISRIEFSGDSELHSRIPPSSHSWEALRRWRSIEREGAGAGAIVCIDLSDRREVTDASLLAILRGGARRFPQLRILGLQRCVELRCANQELVELLSSWGHHLSASTLRLEVEGSWRIDHSGFEALDEASKRNQISGDILGEAGKLETGEDVEVVILADGACKGCWVKCTVLASSECVNEPHLVEWPLFIVKVHPTADYRHAVGFGLGGGMRAAGIHRVYLRRRCSQRRRLPIHLI